MGNPFIIAEDLALKTHLAGMTVADEKNSARPIKVWFGYPDVEIRAQEFPFVTIDLIDILPSIERQTSGVIYDNDMNGTVTPVPGESYKYDIPVAYDIVYQVCSYARHPRHDRGLMFQLLNKFPSKFGKLAVPNQLGTRTGYRSMFLDGFVKRDAVDGETGNRRLLRNILTVRVISEMTPLQATNALTDVSTVTLGITSTIPTVN